MPIPFILGAAAIAAAGFGVKKGLDAKEDYEIAEDNNEKAQKIVDKAKEKIEKKRDETSYSIKRLGEDKIKILASSMTDFVNNYQKLKNVEFTDSIGMDELKKFKPESPEFKEMKDVSIEAADMLTAAGGSVAAGTALAAGTYGAVMGGGFALASTGTAIGALSGAAATNATLAWLGGGAIGSSATAFGMAGGMAVLGGLVAGPALAIGGMFMASKAEEALNESRSNLKQAEKFKEEGKNIRALLKAIIARADQIDGLLIRLNSILNECNADMRDVITKMGTDYKLYSVSQRRCISKAVMTALTIKTAINTSLLTEDGKLDKNSEGVILVIEDNIAKIVD